jgi:hypothetical protein
MALGQKVVEREVLGEKLHVRKMNGGKNSGRVIALLEQIKTEKAQSNLGALVGELLPELGARLVVGCICDAEGKALYADHEQVQEEATFEFLNAFIEVGLEVSGLGEEAATIQGNSPAVQ